MWVQRSICMGQAGYGCRSRSAVAGLRSGQVRRENRGITGADGSNTVLKASRRASGTWLGRDGVLFRLRKRLR